MYKLGLQVGRAVKHIVDRHLRAALSNEEYVAFRA
jgi:hypothetical protein